MSNSSTGFTTTPPNTANTDPTTTTTTPTSSTISTVTCLGGCSGCGGGGGGGGGCPSPPSHDHFSSFLPPPSSAEQLCYVHCNFCDTVLAVSVPCTSLFKTVTVRCGHCSNLLSVNMRGLLLPTPSTAAAVNHPQLHLPHTPFFTPHNLLDEIRNSSPNLLMNHQAMSNHHEQMLPVPGVDYHDLPKPPVVNRPPEKRQRVPSAYNRFIKEEIQRIKAGNPDISHREAFSAAAKNWAHFPHIHFGLMPDHQPVKKANMRQQDGEDHGMMKDGFLSATTNVGVLPY